MNIMRIDPEEVIDFLVDSAGRGNPVLEGIVTRKLKEQQEQVMDVPAAAAAEQIEVEPQAAQEGGPIENAETDLETRVGPMGVINDRDGDPGPSLGGEGVADDLTMEVPEGSYILNSDAVSLIGISDINSVIRDAYTIAAALGKELPADYDPQNKVPIRISNGEAVIPAPLVGVIGLDRLERWNKKGLEVRRQREEAEKAQAKTQVAQPATEAPPVQPMQAQMGGMMGYKDGDEVEDRDLATRISSFFGVEDVPKDILSWFEDNRKDIVPESILDIPKSLSDIPESLLDIWEKRDKLSGIFNKPLSKEELSGIIEKHYGGTPPEEFRDYFYKDNPRTIEEVFQSLKNAEWRNTPELQSNDTLKFTGLDTANKYGRFSSAFGDIQITVSRAEDLLKLIPKENLGLKEYTEKFINQGNARISQLQHLNSAKRKRMKKQNLPIPKPDLNLLGKGEGNISREEHEKYYRELSDLHLNDIIKRIRLAE